MRKSIFGAIASTSLAAMLLLTACGTADENSSKEETTGAAATESKADESYNKIIEAGKLVLGLDEHLSRWVTLTKMTTL